MPDRRSRSGPPGCPRRTTDARLLVVQAVELRAGEGDRLVAQRVVECRSGGVALGPLHEDRLAGKAEVVAGVVDVQVAIGDGAHVLGAQRRFAQDLVEWADDRMEDRLSLCVAGGEAGVEEDRAVGVSDQERGDHDDRALEVGRARELRRHGVVAHRHADHVTCAQHHAVRRRGSSASRSESPNRLKPKTARLMAIPGAMASHGARSRNCIPAPRSIKPHEGVGSNTPRPRNDSEASSRIAWPRNAVIMIRYGAKTFGATCRNMIRTAPVPTDRVASMYGISTIASALERTTRATRGMIGTVIAAITFMILSSPVPRAATTAIAMTMSGKLRSTSMSRWTI